MREANDRLVGRATELSELDTALARAISTDGAQLVSVIGPAGIGKSRLLAEWARRLTMPGPPLPPPSGAPPGTARPATTRPRIVHGRAAPSTTSPRPYAVIASLLRHRFGIGEGDSEVQIVEKMRAAIQTVFGDRRIGEVVQYLGRFLGLSARDSAFTRALEDQPREHDRVARAVLHRFIEFDARRSPLVLVFDDLHFADDQSVDLIGELATELGGSPVVLVVLARPELFARHGRFGEGTAHRRLSLSPLDRQQSEQLLRDRLVGVRDIPPSVIEDVCTTTVGNPYFVEELVRLFFADGVVVREQGMGGSDALHIDVVKARRTQLPVTVDEAVHARIASLSTHERDLLEKAAVFGNVFWSGALVSLARLDHDDPALRVEGDRLEITTALDELCKQDYLLRMPDSSLPAEREYVFKHNLERDLVVRMTPALRARQVARFATQWLETHLDGTRTDEQLEFLATLHERSENRERAASTWIRAGDGARARYENEAAANCYQRGLKLLGSDELLLKLEVLHNLGDVYARTGRIQDALQVFQEMLRAAWLLDLPAKEGAAQGRIGRCHRSLGEYDLAEHHLGLALGLFDRAGDPRGVAGAEDDLGKISFLRGDYQRAVDRHTRALELRRRLGEPRSIALAIHNLGQVARASGRFAEAMTRFDEALRIRREIGDRQGVATSLVELGTVWRERGNADHALAVFREGLELAKELGERLLEAELLNRIGEALAWSGHPAEAVVALGQAAIVAEELGDKLAQTEATRLLGESRLALGNERAARAHCERSLELAERIGSRRQRALSHRALANVLAASAAPEEQLAADRHYRQALDLLGILGGQGQESDLVATFRAYGAALQKRGEGRAAELALGRADELQAALDHAVAAAADVGDG